MDKEIKNELLLKLSIMKREVSQIIDQVNSETLTKEEVEELISKIKN